jgi:hypothetical protein
MVNSQPAVHGGDTDGTARHTPGAGWLGELVDRVSPEQQWGIDEALMTVPGLR